MSKYRFYYDSPDGRLWIKRVEVDNYVGAGLFECTENKKEALVDTDERLHWFLNPNIFKVEKIK